MSEEQLYLLKTRRFLPFFITQLLQVFNDTLFKSAMVMLITYTLVTASSIQGQLLITLSGALFLLPFFVFSAIAGQLADKYDRTLLTRIIKFFEIVIVCFGINAFYTHSITLLMLTLFLMGSHSAFFSAIKYSVLPDYLEKNELIAGNAYVEASSFLSILFGTLIGGVLILLPGGITLTSALLLIVAFTAFVASFFIPRIAPANPHLQINFNVASETKRILHYSTHRRDVFLSILGISWFWMVGGTLLGQFPTLVKEVLFAKPQIVTLFTIIFSIGVAAGSLSCNRLLHGEVTPKYVPLGIFGTTVFLLDLYFACRQLPQPIPGYEIGLLSFLLTPIHWRIMLDMLLLAFSGGIYIVPLYAIMQTRSKPKHRSRTIASNNIMNSLFTVTAALLVALLFMLRFSLLHILLILAAGNAVVTVITCKLLPHVLLQSFTRWLLTSVYRVKIIGLHHYQEAGKRVIIIANNASFLHVALLSAFLPDKFIFAVNKRTGRKWWMRPLLVLVDPFFVDANRPFALRSLVREIKEGRKCVIFPEGRLTVSGSLMKIYESTALIAENSRAVILPVRIKELYPTLFSRFRGKIFLRWLPKITITLFPPQFVEAPALLESRKRRYLITEQIYDMMTVLMFTSNDYKKTLFESLLEASKMHGGRRPILAESDDPPITYNELISQSFMLAATMKNTAPGEGPLGILMENALATLVLFFACQIRGQTVLFLDFSTSPENILSACQRAGVKRVFTSYRLINTIKLSNTLNILRTHSIEIIFQEELSISIFNKIKGGWYSWFPAHYYKRLSHTRSSKSYAVIFNNVILSHENIQANRFQVSTVLNFSLNDVVLVPLPLYYSFSLIIGTLHTLFSGIKVVFYPFPHHYRIISKMLYKTGANMLFATAPFLSQYARQANTEYFYNLRTVFSIQNTADHNMRQYWQEKFSIRIMEAWGCNESSAILATNTPLRNKPGTLGRLLPGVKYHLKPVQGVFSGGRLFISGPQVAYGYFNPQGAICTFPHGGWDTGKIVTLDEQGFINEVLPTNRHSS